MNGLKTWLRTFREFGKTDMPLETATKEGEEEFSQYALRMYRLQQLKELDERLSLPEKTSEHPPEAMNFESAKNHWFEFSSGRQAPQEHQGKQYKITSDTWNRLSASLKTIEERAKEEQAKNSSATESFPV